MSLKLTKDQRHALANKIAKEIKQPAIDFNKELKDSYEYKTFLDNNEDYIIASSLNIKYKNIFTDYNLSRLGKRILEEEFNDRLMKVSNVSTDSIENDIILETIECDNLESLITKIKDKYLA